MARYFLDTSALIKRYVRDEPGHQWIAELCAYEAGHTIVIAEIALVEVVATFCRMARETPPRLTMEDRDALIALFQRKDVLRDYAVVSVQRDVIERAAMLCHTHPLRAYDAVQLACAFQARDDAQVVGVTPPVFVCADTNLLASAAAEGMGVDNPNDHL
jgi:predicted nucleic acid-binding protein